MTVLYELKLWKLKGKIRDKASVYSSPQQIVSLKKGVFSPLYGRRIILILIERVVRQHTENIMYYLQSRANYDMSFFLLFFFFFGCVKVRKERCMIAPALVVLFCSSVQCLHKENVLIGRYPFVLQ